MIKSFCKEFPSNPHGKELLGSVIKRLLEQRNGKYSFKEMHSQVVKANTHHYRLEYATHIGPIEVKPTLSSGRGLFTTRAVKAGDLLLCEKAMEYYNAEHRVLGHVLSNGYSLSLECGKAVPAAKTDLAQRMIGELSSKPSLIADFMDLYRGSYASTISSFENGEGEAVIDA